jgi:hypothetical protein
MDLVMRLDMLDLECNNVDPDRVMDLVILLNILDTSVELEHNNVDPDRVMDLVMLLNISDTRLKLH